MHIIPLKREVRRVARERPVLAPRINLTRWGVIAALYVATLVLVSPFYFGRLAVHRAGDRITEPLLAAATFRVETPDAAARWEEERERGHRRIYIYDPLVHQKVVEESEALLSGLAGIDAAGDPQELLNLVRRLDGRFSFLTLEDIGEFVRVASDPRFRQAMAAVVEEAYERQVVVDTKSQFLAHRKLGVADIRGIDQLMDQRRRALLNPLSGPVDWDDWAPMVRRKFHEQFGDTGQPPSAPATAERMLRIFARPNITFAARETDRAYREYPRPDLSTRYRRGDTLIEPAAAGRSLSQNDVKLLAAHRVAVRRDRDMRLLGHAVFVLMVFIIFSFYVQKFSRELSFTVRNVLMIASPGLVVLTTQFIYMLVTKGDASTVGYLFPAGSLGLLGVLLLDVRMALLMVTWVNLLFGLQVNLEYEFVIIGLFAGYTAVAALYTIRKRWEIFLASVFIALAAGSVIVVLNFVRDPTSIPWTYALLGAVNGFLSFLVLAILPIYERFGIVTDMQLLELSGLHHPLLRQLEEAAPGTWQHTLNVTKLAEAAASEIGVNYLLVRTGCYFHDIGKMKKPEYFTENQVTKEDKMRHAELKPQMSTLVIKNHVKEGAEMARREGLPERIIDFIRQHHGTSVIAYFYHKALEAHARGDIKEPVRIEDYRYPWQKPQTIEAAIVMLADSVEATATAKLSGRTVREDDIKQVVRTIVFEKFNDGQFDECPLTMRDLNLIRETFVRVLKSRFHTRIDYPKKAAKPAAPPPAPKKEKEPREGAEARESREAADAPLTDSIPLAAQE